MPTREECVDRAARAWLEVLREMRTTPDPIPLVSPRAS